ncbi:MAG: DNA-binding response regulator [Alphaproteobacteria bacterium]|nr:MAG: DNA-binding response regulator [Alphaproteobacteria bacterium]
MMSGRLLIVDDEPQIVRALRPGLLAAGYEVDSVGDGREALQTIAAGAYDAIIVDLGLPDMDGKDVIARAREWTDTPIVVLSARHAEEEKIAALDLGANDFVAKPFGIGELMARLRAVLRVRGARAAMTDKLSIGHLDIDFSNRRMKVAGKEVRPSPRELRLLRAFTQHIGAVLTHKQIVAAVWGGDEHVETQFVRVLVGNLRQKVEIDPARPSLIMTEPGVGYRFIDPNEESAA